MSSPTAESPAPLAAEGGKAGPAFPAPGDGARRPSGPGPGASRWARRALSLAARRWAADIWLRHPDRALRLLESELAQDYLEAASLSLLAWLRLTEERDEPGAERAARAALERPGDTRFATAALVEILRGRGEVEAAVEELRRGRARRPDIRWYDLSLSDVLVEAGRVEEAERILEGAADDGELRRHALKRLSRLALERGDRDRARRWFTELLELAPNYLVYASDYETLGDLQLEAGDPEAARATWRAGAEMYARHEGLRERLRTHFGEEPPDVRPKIQAVDEGTAGVRRLPIKTPYITLRSDLAALIDEATAGVRAPGDVIALAESPAAAAQGRVLPLELITPGRLAAFLSGYVGEIGPLHSPPGMQGAVLEAGRARVVLGAAAGAAGKLAGRRGWFYRVAGRATAMIDDVAAALPPNDHHLVLGPRDPDGLASGLSAALGCPVAIVDANHLSGAWVVGASAGVDREWLTEVLRDNPAGNEDEQTPVVIVRRVSDRPA